MAPVVVFDDVSKKFRRGERHDSLRDLIPSLVRAAFRRRDRETLNQREFWALRNVSFEVEPGQAIGIIGANGAGKSTTLKVLTRILRPTTGRCGVEGRIGALIEIAAGFHPDLTGRENIFLQGAIMGMTRVEIAQRFDEIVEFAGVGDFVDTQVKRYSSGMNARLGFSIAAHLRPDVLIIDEVLAVGDMAFQQKCFDRMHQFKRDGIAIVLVSHNLQAVASLCDHAVFLAGSVKAAGPTAEVLDAYVRSSRKLEHPSGTGVVEMLHATLDAPGTPRTTDRPCEVAPGTALVLRVRLRSAQPFDDVTFGLLIERSTDHLLVYNGQMHRRELGTPAEFSGEFSLTFRFAANLVRGHYYVSVHVLNNPLQQFILLPQQVATFVVRETRSKSGVADVGFSAELGAAAELSDVRS